MVCTSDFYLFFSYIQDKSYRLKIKLSASQILLTWLLRNTLGRLRLRCSSNCSSSNTYYSTSTACRGRSFLFQHRPIEGVVVLVIQSTEQNAEQLAKVHIVGSFFEPQSSAIVQVHGEFCWEALEATKLDKIIFQIRSTTLRDSTVKHLIQTW